MKPKELFKYRIFIFFYALLIMLWLWTSGTCCVQAFKCPQMTQTQLFLNIPNSFVCDWKNCN